jgi:hypothetical protein
LECLVGLLSVVRPRLTLEVAPYNTSGAAYTYAQASSAADNRSQQSDQTTLDPFLKQNGFQTRNRLGGNDYSDHNQEHLNKGISTQLYIIVSFKLISS